METESEDVHTLKSKISNVQNDMKLNPYNYDGNVELISLLSKLYHLYKSKEVNCDENSEEKKTITEQKMISFKKLRHARQSMCAVYPLSVELWLKWIDDEVSLNSGLINHEIIQEIFSKSTIDYISVDIWCCYLNYLIRQLEDNSSTPDLIRDTFETAVTNCGLHYQDGHKIWKCYQDFELKFLIEAEKLAQENNNEINIKQFKMQLLKVIKLYKREMSLALKHDDLLTYFRNSICPYVDTLKSLSSESSIINLDEIEKDYQNTSERIKSIATNEDYLEESQHSFEAYQSYITHELNEGLNDPARIQCLFERAVVYHCLKPSLWLDYIDFLTNTIRLPDLIISVCKRALRNVSWDSRIDIKYALILEDLSNNEDEIRAVYEEGLQKYSTSGYNYCNIIIAFLSFEKRISKDELSLNKKRSRIYLRIQQAVHQLEQIDDANKNIGEFVLFWADIERSWFRNKEKVKDIWKYMLAKNKSLWCHAMAYARTVDDKDLVNDMFSIVSIMFPDDVETFSQSMLNYENVFGTSESLNSVMKKINLCLSSRLQVRNTKECKSLLSKIEHRYKFIKSWLRNAEEALFSFNKYEISSSESSPRKTKRSHEAVLESKITSNKNEGIKKMYLDVDDKKGKSEDAPIIGPVLPLGFISKDNSDSDSEDEDEENPPPSKKQKVSEENPSDKNILGFDTHPQNTTVFVSNLHPATKETDLKMIFSRAGEVQKVDLRKQKGGKIFAFVTYSTPEEALKAFELEHTPLLNRPLFVSEFKYAKHSDKSHTQQSTSSKYSQQQERNKLFVTNLHKATTQLDLEKLFNQYGDMTSLRLINKKGSSKSFAYIEYETVEAASRYRTATNNSVVRGLPIIVEFSNPSLGNRSNRDKQIHFEEDNIHSDDKKRRETSDVHKISADDKTFVKPKPVKLGFIPTQTRRNQQPINSQITKKGPAVKINFVPSNGDTNPKTESASHETEHTVPASNGEQSSTAAVSSARKSNDDFRKMFFKN